MSAAADVLADVPPAVRGAEGDTLIEDWLTEEGQHRYIIEDDEFSRLDRWVVFFRKLVSLTSACVVRFGRPIDPFGNPIEVKGFRSLAAVYKK